MVSQRTLGFLLALLTIAGALTSCFRDGFECAADSDCFGAESCESGECVATVPNSCQAESPDDLCAAADPCQADLEITDSCGTLRQVTCDCTDTCVPDSPETLCQSAGAECGSVTVTDNCEEPRDVMCGTCTGSESCVDNRCTECGEAPVCPPAAQCGVVTNSCGDSTTCGEDCGPEQLCLDFECADPVLQPAETEEGDRFGEAIRIDGDHLLIGAPNADLDELSDVGRIYVFERSGLGWSQRQILENPVAADGRRFGSVFDARDGRLVAATGDNAVFYERSDEGLYEFQSGTTEPGLIRSIAILADGEFLMTYEDTDGDSTVIDYVTCGSGSCSDTDWSPSDQVGEPGSLMLGVNLHADGDFVIAGAPADNIQTATDGEAEGSFYVFSGSRFSEFWSVSGWVASLGFYRYEEYQGYPVGPQPTGVGSSVAISADGYAVAGAPLSNRLMPGERIGQLLMLMPMGEQPLAWRERYTGIGQLQDYRCGYAVGLTGGADDKIAILSCMFDWPRERSDEIDDLAKRRTVGEIWHYTADLEQRDWNLGNTTLTVPDGQFFDHFGWAIEAQANEFLVGAPGRDQDRGAVYIYETEVLR